MHLRFRRGYVKQGRDLNELPYRAFAYPFSGLFACILTVLIILGQGYESFAPSFDRIKFLTSYIGVVPAILCYIGYKLVRRSKVVPILEIDYDTGRATYDDMMMDEEAIGHIPWWKRILAWIF